MTTSEHRPPLRASSDEPSTYEPKDGVVTDPKIDVTECPDCSQKGTYEARVLINGRGFYTCPDGHRWQDINEKPSDKGIPLRGAGGAS